MSSAHYNLYRVLKKKGHTVRVFTNADPDTAPHVDVTKRRTPRFLQSIVRLLLAVYFRFHADKEKHYQLGYILSAAWASFLLAGPIKRFRPDILIVPDVSAPLFFIRRIHSCRIFLIAHHNPVRFLHNPLFHLHSERDARLAVGIEDKALSYADTVICPSRYMEEVFQKTYHVSKPIIVIPNIVDEELINMTDPVSVSGQCEMPGTTICIHIPSAGSEIKGAKYVFEIIRRLSAFANSKRKPVCFYLSGPINESLKFELDHIRPAVKIFSPGKVPYEKNIAYMKSCSFTVSPTLLENYGMAQLESMMCGVPVVSFNVGGNKEIIEHGINGFLVPYLDIEALVECSKKMFDTKVIRVLRKNIQKAVVSKFNSHKVIDRFVKELFPS